MYGIPETSKDLWFHVGGSKDSVLGFLYSSQNLYEIPILLLTPRCNYQHGQITKTNKKNFQAVQDQMASKQFYPVNLLRNTSQKLTKITEAWNMFLENKLRSKQMIINYLKIAITTLLFRNFKKFDSCISKNKPFKHKVSCH